MNLTADAVDQVDRVAGPVDEHRPAGLVLEGRDQIVNTQVLTEQMAVLRIAILLGLPTSADIFVPALLQGEMPVRFHRPQHRREVRGLVLLRYPFAAVRKKRLNVGVSHRHDRANRDAAGGDGFLHYRDVSPGTLRNLDDLVITAPLKHKLHDLSVVGHTAPSGSKQRH